MTTIEEKTGWDRYLKAVDACQPMKIQGKIVKVAGLIAEGHGPGLCIGGLCAIENLEGRNIQAEVVGFRDKRVILMPFGETRGIRPGSRIVDINKTPAVRVGEGYLGRVIDGLGCPIDQKGVLDGDTEYPLYGEVLNPMKREIIREVVDVGISSINALITLGKGQRIAIMAGSGVGKSVLMGMMAKNTAADVVVIALIGERGREVREFVERNLTREGLKKSVVVAATSDTPALVRIRGAYLATAIAEFFRDKGFDVILMVDSVTRFAMALREVGLAAGEPPSAKGYTPSVFAQIPKLLERAGTLEKRGSITGIYTVLVEGDDMNEPIADAVRSTVDGHIVLSRTLAHRGHYPAVDILASISRVMKDIVDSEHLDNARRLVNILATYRQAEDLINIGAYVDGSDPNIDYAKTMIGDINTFLRQGVDEQVSFEESVARLKALLSGRKPD
ncbi:MAG: FliI/YscN family ATPase [Deltaproteobacteria bacterium]|nr:FliI/YscN family ATPase [Deltaproteobacteria bacterium]MBW1976399.1 FliI/YscN family ATPase [Deltaproteobacteria bacterium]MBW2043323.1 FliI/YscN family ATPase [Deltaproteobacteria bacterium]MBW2299385.1 FliI/YscN family ATPase [Deltaproteobacteria bacterium]